MAGPSDKARFYLEQSVPELHELERKKVFSRDEISTIAKKRSDFELILNARGSKPSDYLRYIEFELNLDTLRRKRIHRLKIKATGSGAKRIFFLFQRGTRKFPGDLGLWMQYIEFARKEKSYRKLNEILTSVVRLHPTKPELWIYAARYFMDSQADITNARSYMQRGLRFCKSSKKLWLEYAKLETLYIGKIAGRRKILGLDIDRSEKVEKGEDENMIALPSVSADDINPKNDKEDEVDEAALRNLESAPVLTGAIPIAVFDAAMKQFGGSAALAEDFFFMFAEFDQLPCLSRLLQHVLDHLQQHSSAAPETASCYFQIPLIGVHPSSSGFPAALREALDRLATSLQQSPQMKAPLSEAAVRRLVRLAANSEGVDETVRKVLKSTLRKYCRSLEEAVQSDAKEDGDAIGSLAEELQRAGRVEEAKFLTKVATKQWSGNEKLLQLQKLLDS
ncbi:rRNA processing protein-like protein Utp6 [Delitschia confertaspora ATCC 74209]|uniref:rRNA processing protein-like protein Utp6 n=1 Tax=Delitschia confertaspora ATCC 74209 TaxID=1513339 RepID=A0A9P4MMQ9_9PLEO|nr:rRNA processing protein-like protein Utp6 [Delitschia confertaspora ATCC 74209]